jgi:hypothetical protein
MRGTGHVARTGRGGGERCIQVLVGKPGEKRLAERPSRRWEDNIKIYLQDVGREVLDWIDLAQDRNKWRLPSNAVGKFRLP